LISVAGTDPRIRLGPEMYERAIEGGFQAVSYGVLRPRVRIHRFATI